MFTLTKDTMKMAVISIICVIMATAVLMPAIDSLYTESSHEYTNTGEEYRGTMIAANSTPGEIAYDFSAKTVTIDSVSHDITNTLANHGWDGNPLIQIYLTDGTKDPIAIKFSDATYSTYSITFTKNGSEYTMETFIDGASQGTDNKAINGIFAACDDGSYGFWSGEDTAEDAKTLHVASPNDITGWKVLTLNWAGCTPCMGTMPTMYGETMVWYLGSESSTLPENYTKLSDGSGEFSTAGDNALLITTPGYEHGGATNYTQKAYIVPLKAVVGGEAHGSYTLELMASLIPIALILGLVLVLFRSGRYE